MLTLSKISKQFGAVAALEDVSLSFEPGSVHAVLGENGAGKTTLMRILYGLLRPDAGLIMLNGLRLELRRPADAQRAGIGMVHQHFKLVEQMTVAENIVLGERGGGAWLPRSAVRRRALNAARRVGLAISPDERVEALSVGQRQRVEILKVLQREVSTLILDEPTAVLTPTEVEQLFGAIRGLRASGCRVIFISHKLAEVKAISDTVSVLRRGRLVCTEPIGTRSAADLAERMVGARLTPSERRPGRRDGEIVMEVREPALTVRRGEVVGIAGVDGNGQHELTRAIIGRLWPAYIADDRQREALILPMSVAENVVLKRHAEPAFSRGGWLRRSTIGAFAEGIVREFDVRGPGVRASVATLSGGNQQKLVVGRELSSQPGLLVAANPTRGLDVASTRFVHSKLIAARNGGAGVLLISADLDEILLLADRVFVIFDGRLTEVTADSSGSFDAATIGRMMAGLAA